MQLSVLLSMGLALLPAMAEAADGGFNDSCRSNWRIFEDRYLVACCKKKDGSYRTTRQDLNLCVRNDAGHLKPADNGGFSATCDGCWTNSGTGQITCNCAGGGGEGRTPTKFNLNKFVSNNDGYLWCFGHRSAPFSSTWFSC